MSVAAVWQLNLVLHLEGKLLELSECVHSTPTHSLTHWLTHSLSHILLTAFTLLRFSLVLEPHTEPLFTLVTHWLTDSLTDWLTDSLTDSLTHSLTHWLTDALTHWLTHSLTHSLTHWLTHSLTDWVTDFYFWHQRATWETCDLSDISSEGWGDMNWPRKDLPTYIPTHLPTYLPTYVPLLENTLNEQS